MPIGDYTNPIPKSTWVFSTGTDYSKWIRPCGATGSDPLTEPGPFRWEPEAEVSEGFATLHKTFYFTLTDYAVNTAKFWDGGTTDGASLHYLPRIIPPSEIMRSSGFPKKGEKLAEDPNYHYTGNGTIRHISHDSRIWEYQAEYTSRIERDANGDDEDENSEPWSRRPTNVSVEFVERDEPFTVGYRQRDWARTVHEIPNTGIMYQSPIFNNIVRNSAGDPINARCTRSRTQIRFTYNIKPGDFNVNDIIDCRGSINKKEIRVIGLRLKPGQARLVDIHPEYKNEWRDGTFTKRWNYWQISVTMEASTKNDTFNQKLLNVGNRALFHQKYTIDSTGHVTQENGPYQRARICQWNSWSTAHGQADGTPQFGSIHHAMTARTLYDKQRNNGHKEDWPAFSYEEGNDIPLWYNGTIYYNAMNPNHADFGKYLVIEYPEWPWEDWEQLNLPKKGVDW